jgi:acyl transferase domain-containing protein
MKAMRNGECDSAIVGGSNLTLHPFISLQFARLGVLSPDGKCKSFDASGEHIILQFTNTILILILL